MKHLSSKPGFSAAFTLIELLVVIGIIAVLAGILLPVMSNIQQRAHVVQAKSDERSLVGAAMAFKAEYGHNPVPPGSQRAGQYTFGEYPLTSAVFIEILSADISKKYGETDATVTLVKTLNPNMNSYLTWPIAKNAAAAKPRGGLGFADGQPYDPWGRVYIIRIDTAGNDMVPNPYKGDTAGGDPLPFPVICWSFGPDGLAEGLGVSKNFRWAIDDVISWQ